MNKLSLVALLLVLLLAACSTLKKPFFYEITKDDSRAYLLGTLHTGVTVDQLPFFVFGVAHLFGTKSVLELLF